MKSIIAALVVVYALVRTGEGCSCMRIEPIKHYCESEFVARMTIGDRHEETDSRVYYDITKLDVLRATEKGRYSLEGNRLYTSANSAMCGVSFEKGTEYLITGHIGYHNMSATNLCSFNAVWTQLSDNDKKNFEGKFKC